MNTEWKPIPASLYDLIFTGDLEALLWQLKGVREAEEVRMALYNARKAILDTEEYSDCTPAPTSHPIPTGATGEDTDSFDDPSTLAAVADALAEDTSNDNAQFAAAYLYRQAKAIIDTPAAGDAQMLEFVREVAQQKPEKPDYWSSCSQCERNTSTAEDLLEAHAAIAQQSQRKEA